MLKLSERFYRLLLRLYPAVHRREYGELMAQAFRDQCKAVHQQHGKLALLWLWLYILVDTLAAATIEHRELIKNRTITTVDTHYTKHHFTLVFVPLVVIIVYIYLAQDFRDMAAIYVMILIAGIVAWLLNRLGVMSYNPIWRAYTGGILLGAGTIGLLIVSAALALAIYRLALPSILIMVVSILIYIAVTLFSGRLTGNVVRSYRIMALFLALIGVAAFMVSPTFMARSDNIGQYVTLNYSLMYPLMTFLATAVSIYWTRYWGKLGPVALMTAIGVQFIIVDPGYFTGAAGRWINLATLLFPLVICPAWWLFISEHRVQAWGTLALWGVFICIVAFAPTLARVAIGINYEPQTLWLYRALNTLPYFAVMWLALHSFATSGTQPQQAQDAHPQAASGVMP